jgi:hypothetical protein
VNRKAQLGLLTVARITVGVLGLGASTAAAQTRTEDSQSALVSVIEAARFMPALQRQIRVDIAAALLADALRWVTTSAEMNFVWDASIAELACTVSLDADRIRVAEALTQLMTECSSAQPFELLVSGSTLVVRRRAQVLRPQAAVPGSIEGTISDAETGGPVPGARVEVDGSGIDVSTDAGGRFVIPSVREGAHSIRVSHRGRTPVQIDGIVVRDGSTLRLALRIHVAPVRLADIVVSPSRYAVLDAAHASRAINHKGLEAMPQLSNDPLRAASRLPGVSMNDLTARLQALGGTGDDLLITLDGVELVDPYHLGPFGQVVSLIDARVLQGMTLSTGAFGVEHGNRIAGVLAMRSMDGRLAPARGTVNASVVDVATHAASRPTSKVDWFAAGRYGYPERALFQSGVEGNLASRYGNVFAKATREIGTDTFAVHVMAARDRFHHEPVFGGPELGEASHLYLWSTGRIGIGRDATLHQILSIGRVQTDRQSGNSGAQALPAGAITGSNPVLSPVFADEARGTLVAAVRHDWRWAASRRWLPLAGIEIRHAATDADYSLFRAAAGGPADRRATTLEATTMSGYAAVRMRWTPSTVAEVGQRYDRHSRTGRRSRYSVPDCSCRRRSARGRR